MQSVGGKIGRLAKSHSRVGEEAGTCDGADLHMEPAEDGNVNKREEGGNNRTDEKLALSA